MRSPVAVSALHLRIARHHWALCRRLTGSFAAFGVRDSATNKNLSVLVIPITNPRAGAPIAPLDDYFYSFETRAFFRVDPRAEHGASIHRMTMLSGIKDLAENCICSIS